MADSVYDLQKALRTSPHDAKPRADSDPGFPDNTTPKAMDLAVPGGFRRHHLARGVANAPVSEPLRDAIIDKIAGVYDPVISSMLSQDNDAYDEMSVQERVQSLLHTPTIALRLPQYRRTPTKEYDRPIASLHRTDIEQYLLIVSCYIAIGRRRGRRSARRW